MLKNQKFVNNCHCSDNGIRELSLFTGVGGGILGSKLLGWTTIGYVEWNNYCQRVLRQRIEDGLIDNAPIFGDIIACQPFSVAGKQGLFDVEVDIQKE